MRARCAESTKEGREGADWEWWFGADGKWFGMRVQANKLKEESLEYEHLDHVTKKTKRRQVDNLIDKAAAHTPQLYPLYCFYNHWRKPEVSPRWRCGSFNNEKPLWGATVADAERVRQALNDGIKGFDAISEISMPLICLACCRVLASDRERTLPHRARGIAEALNQGRDVPPISDHPPHYVPQLQTQSPSNLDIPQALADLDGILIIEARPDVYDELRNEMYRE